MWKQAAVTVGASALAIGALIVTGQPEPTVTASHCLASVDEGLDWWSEGTADYRVIDPETVEVMTDGCRFLGDDSEAMLWEDGSWSVTATSTHVGASGLTIDQGTWWKGCMSEEAPCAD
jgi:hypothetical protein